MTSDVRSHPPIPQRFERYVAIGDSSTEGVDDRDGRGGYRGWSTRLAEMIAARQGSLLYANLGIRGRRTRQIREQQLERAAAMTPDLATLFSGTNDVIGRHFDADAIAEDMAHMQRTLIKAGATVLTFTLPDLTPVMPIAWFLSPRVRALNEAIRGAAQRTGAVLVDFAQFPVAADPRLWSDDRIHANAQGHARIASALAYTLGLDGVDRSWAEPLPPAPACSPVAWLRAEIGWGMRHLVPWIGAGLSGSTLGDDRQPKRPRLEAVVIESSIVK